MKSKRPHLRAVAFTLLGTLLATIAVTGQASDNAAPAPLALRKIMQDLGKSMQAITQGISTEDWVLVAKTAALIADHPQPPLGEKMRILGFIGTDSGMFKNHDEKTKQASLVLQQTALLQDGPGVIAAFAHLQNTCLACHQGFRTSFTSHFYAKH